jgi:capsular polysaccharide biosynthesis protein
LSLVSLVTLLHRWAWLLIGAALLAGLSGYYVAGQGAPTYEASTRLLVGPFSADINAQRASGQLTLTYAELVRSRPVVQATVDELGLAAGPERLAETIMTSANSATRVLTISLEGADPESVATIVNSLVQNLITYAVADGTRPEGRLTVIDPARAIDTPVGPRPAVPGLIALVAGFLAALLLAVVLESLDNGVRSRAQLAALTGAPVLATVKRRRRWGGLRSPETLLDPASEEGFRMDLLSAKIEFSSGVQTSVRSIVLLSIDPRGGNGWLSVNLAGALALRGRQVALVDVDPVGEVSLLLERDARAKGASKVPPGAHLVRRRPEELEQLSSRRAREILTGQLAYDDVAVIHTPPVQGAPNAIVWAGAADAVVLVVRSGDPAPAVSELADTLRLIEAPLIGSIFVQGPRVTPPAERASSQETEQLEEPLPQR